MDEHEAQDKAESIVYLVWQDLTERRGLRRSWDNISAGLKAEILDHWVTMTRQVIRDLARPPREGAGWDLFYEERGRSAIGYEDDPASMRDPEPLFRPPPVRD